MRSVTTTRWWCSPRPCRRNRRAFTLIELLVVIGIIAIVISLLGVAFSGALGTSRNAATASLMHNIQTGVQQFETDFGYLPPLIDGEKRALDFPESGQTLSDFQQELKNHRYHSVYTLPLYLLGVGELAPFNSADQPGDDPDRNDGKQGPGFRDPGPDHSWGGARVRDLVHHKPKRTGRVYGPYIDIGDGEDVLRRAECVNANDCRDFVIPSGGNINDYFANDNTTNDSPAIKGDLFVIQDRWGQAIRYYKNWPTRQKVNNAIRSSIDQVPIELRTFKSITQTALSPGTGLEADPLLDQDLIRAPYALLSAGADADFGDTDANGVWIDEQSLFSQPDAAIVVAKRIKDNIRTTP